MHPVYESSWRRCGRNTVVERRWEELARLAPEPSHA